MTQSSQSAIELDTHLHLMRSGRELASLMGVSRNYLTAMKFTGFTMPGGKASLAMARQYIYHSPKFRVTEHPQEPPPPPASSFGTTHAPRKTNGQRKPLSETH